MDKDKTFILLLIIMLPLSGCMDMTDNAEGQEASAEELQTNQNQLPVIWGYVSFGAHYCAENGTTSVDLLVARATYALDFDGNISQFGLDVNQDAIIDFPITSTCEGADYQPVIGTNSTDWMNPIPMNEWGSHPSSIEGCYQDISLIAIDNDGGLTANPMRLNFDYDRENEVCLLEP